MYDPVSGVAFGGTQDNGRSSFCSFSLISFEQAVPGLILSSAAGLRTTSAEATLITSGSLWPAVRELAVLVSCHVS